MTNFTIAGEPHYILRDGRFQLAVCELEKPLSRKKLRQLMPLNHRGLTGYALQQHGHKRGPRNRIGAPKPYKMSALDGSIVVKPHRVGK